MKINIFKYIILLISLAFVAGCDEDIINADSGFNKTPINDPIPFGNNYSPYSLGSWWLYDVTYIESGATDELLVTMSGYKEINDTLKASIKTYAFRDSVHRDFQKYLYKQNDTIFELFDDDFNSPAVAYVLPFELDDKWTTGKAYEYWNEDEQKHYVIDECEVLSLEEVLVTDGWFKGDDITYRISRRCRTFANGSNTYANEIINFLPNRGIVRLSLFDNSEFAGKGTDKELFRWELQKHFIKDPD